ncbi:MAG TPA: hypothetical protein VMI54_06385 [Polyangiaceae bacterium]|nr:hypothetical protein [Polyangiaceae bacterium]
MLKGPEGRGFRRSAAALVAIGVLGGCAPAEKAPATPAKRSAAAGSGVVAAASAPAPEPPAPMLRTGALNPVDDPPRTATLNARADDGAYEILELVLGSAAATPGGGAPAPDALVEAWHSTSVGLEPPLGQMAFTDSGGGLRRVPRIWVRRKKSPEPVTGTVYTIAYDGPGHRVPFRATIDPKAKTDATLVKRWAAAFAQELRDQGDAPDAFAARRLVRVYGEPKPAVSARAARPAPARAVRPRPAPSNETSYELSRLMDTTTGRISVQRALEENRELFVQASKERANLPIAETKPPNLARHPWADLATALGKRAADEALAHAVPAEFYFVRARNFGEFLDVLDVVESFGEPAADVLDGHPEDRDTFARYETELALERTELTRLFGPDVVTDLAITGSDPYVHEGTDLTLIFRVKNTPLFSTALAAALAHHAVAHPNVKESTFTTDGTTVTVRRSADGRIRQHRATVGGFELVSNSPEAIRRVIATIAGKHPNLAAEPDFSYMLARDANTPSDLLGYLGDRFIASVVGPEQKIAEARRQLALGELLVPGYAALARGRIDGAAPKSTAELLRSKFLERSELEHADGSPIEFEPGHAAHSAWGTPAHLEPLIDRPPVTRVTAAERDGYSEFARSYEAMWSDRIDPVALRVTERADQGKRALSADLRVLPTLRNEYRDDIEMVGRARVMVPEVLPGLSAVIGIGADASLRRELTQMSDVFGSGNHFAFDWVGDYALVGVTPRNEILQALRGELSDEIELPDEHARRTPFEEKVANLPVYALLGVKSRVGAGLCLTALRSLAREAAPGALEWGSAPSYHGTEVVAVRFSDGEVRGALYYALTEHALVFSLNETVLHQALDLVTEHPPVSVAPKGPVPSDASQLVVELGSKPGDALFRALAWLADAATTDEDTQASALAAAVLVGAPEQTGDAAAGRLLMREYLGTVVVTPSGQSYSLAPDGIRDPDRGTPNAPIFPELPVLGSPLERVLDAVHRVRTELSFDDEPALGGERPLSSLHARVTLELNPPPTTQPEAK